MSITETVIGVIELFVISKQIQFQRKKFRLE
jgi:hypothetical protein